MFLVSGYNIRTLPLRPVLFISQLTLYELAAHIVDHASGVFTIFF